MTGIPTINFDYFNLAEIPTFILCNPNKEKLYALGGISERKYSPRFNAISELSFRADQYIDGNLMPYYQYITNRRLVYLDNIGYFMITSVTENNDGIVKYKEVGCESLEVELSSRKLTGFVSGSGIYDESGVVSLNPVPVTMTQFYMEILPYLAGWTFDNIPSTLDAKYRSFDVSDTTIYNLLMVDVEEAYECIFDFDTINNRIFIYDANTDIELTDIFISHDNVIKSMTVEEVTDELATCLYVIGGGDLGIERVNPLANNYIYNFQYFKNTDWMSQSLIDSINTWEIKYSTLRSQYYNEVLLYFEDSDDKAIHETQLNIVSGSYLFYDRLYNSYMESGSTVSDPQMIEIENQIIALGNQINEIEDEIGVIDGYMEGHFNVIKEISDSLKLDNSDNFDTVQQRALQPFIIQSSYINDNIIQIEGMTSASITTQQHSLYNQAVSTLEKISTPRYSFEIDSVSFLQIKDFQTFGSQLALGKKITLEIEPGRYLQPTVLGADIDFDNPTSFKLTFGNRLRLNDETYQYNDLMTKALSAGTSMSLNSQAFKNWTRDYKSGYLNLTTGITVDGTEPAEKIDITPGFINLKTDRLQWNGVDLTGGWTFVGGGGGESGSGITNIKITLFSGGVSVAMYEPTSSGLSDAIDASSAGDVIFLPDVEIGGSFRIPSGVNLVGVSSRESIIEGSVTIDTGCLLENLKIINSNMSTTNVYTVLVQNTDGTESSRIKGCEIYAYQCGTGSATALYIGDSVELVVENSTVVADSLNCEAYAFSSNNGNCNVYHSNYYAKTEVFHETTYVPPPP